MKSFKKIPLLLTIIIFFGFVSSIPEEGMFPLSEIHKLDLEDAGLEISTDEIYNPNGVSLIDALVKIGGCTGSFVSNDGLMITNHHCAFGAVNRASTAENNYLRDGFWAGSMENEIPAAGYTVRISESYEDVSDKILSEVENIENPIERNKKINSIISELEEAASDDENSISAKVSEMFIGKTYVLFKYRMIRDVRLVYIPPRTIGEFGGESDNWIWPRHTGDFSFMRAYVAPDGSAASYSEENIPYHPKKFLQVNADGVEENDFVFILGYPGRTFRHLPSQYLEFQKDIQLPYISQLFEWMINLYETESKKSDELQLKYASTIKGLANTMKNYKGKLKGLNRINIIGDKKAEETAMKEMLNQDDELKEKYGDLFPRLELEYSALKKIGYPYFWFALKGRMSSYLDLMTLLSEHAVYSELPDDERPRSFKEDNLTRLIANIENSLSNLDKEIETKRLKKMLWDAQTFPEGSRILALTGYNSKEKINALVEKITNSDIFTPEKYMELFNKSKSELWDVKDTVIQMGIELVEQEKQISDEYESIYSQLNKPLADFVDLKQEFSPNGFTPDANGTLRLTYGYIEGYSPADAVYYSPITTLKGVIDKSTEGGDYQISEKLVEAYNSDIENNQDRPVAILYSTDTTGGNSGSPILNAYGELIGVNFDRAYEATINDFAWDKSYSRSIGVDIRYVIWVTKNIGGADKLLDEMGVDY